MTDDDAIVRRIEAELGVPGLADLLGARLPPADLRSLLLAVHRRQARRLSPAQVLARYGADAFVRPAEGSAAELLEVERRALEALPPGFEPLVLSPVCPLGTVAAVAPIDQNRVVSTGRGTEVVSDPTNVLALEAAARRRGVDRGDPSTTVRLATAHRTLRGQRWTDPTYRQHFAQLALVTAGRDGGSHRFETAALAEHVGFHLRLVADTADLHGLHAVRAALTALDDDPRLVEALGREVVAPLTATFPTVDVVVDETRTRGRGYYTAVALLITAESPTGEPVELADGGATTWTAQLLGDRKERLVISGIGTERLGPPASAR